MTIEVMLKVNQWVGKSSIGIDHYIAAKYPAFYGENTSDTPEKAPSQFPSAAAQYFFILHQFIF